MNGEDKMESPNVGTIVFVGLRDNEDGQVKPCPAIVLKRRDPDGPEGTIDVLVFSYRGADPLRAIPFSESLAENAWSWTT
jgi:hypothetical protein